MNASPAKASSEEASSKQDRWLVFGIGTVLTHLLKILLCPEINGMTSPSWSYTGPAVFFLVLPFAWSIHLWFAARSWRERTVAYLSLLSSVIWLGLAEDVLFQALCHLNGIRYGR
jgi:hypothetical protein